jgi:hypothetical protein
VAQQLGHLPVDENGDGRCIDGTPGGAAALCRADRWGSSGGRGRRLVRVSNACCEGRSSEWREAPQIDVHGTPLCALVSRSIVKAS